MIEITRSIKNDEGNKLDASEDELPDEFEDDEPEEDDPVDEEALPDLIVTLLTILETEILLPGAIF